MSRNSAILILLLLGAVIVPGQLKAADDARQAAPVFEVPTSGTIMDVVYRPEFDEWWIKCREGDSVVVYSYDPESKKWGKVRFVRKKREGKKESAIPTHLKKEKEQQEDRLPQAHRIEKPVQKKDSARRTGSGNEQGTVELPASKKETATIKQETKKTKWWDLRNVLKTGEKLINPFKGEPRKPQVKPDDTIPGG